MKRGPSWTNLRRFPDLRFRKGHTRLEVIQRETRVRLEEVLYVWVIGQMRQDSFDRDSRSAHHRLTDHDLGVLDDSLLIVDLVFFHSEPSTLCEHPLYHMSLQAGVLATRRALERKGWLSASNAILTEGFGKEDDEE